ncbi:hypothetical protein MUP01_04530 [Candidatus Bathyarchaeota archaeon]|nr:hypothetical protein [Candidatus Bathyarchaeota archaeon]
MRPLKPIEKVYWLRLALGAIAGLLCICYGVATSSFPNKPPFSYEVLFNGASIAILTYLISYYAIKAKFKAGVAKPQKLVTTGIGVYLLSWLVFWILLYTIIAGPPPISA